MVDILISVAKKVAEYLVDPIKLQLSYLFNTHNYVQDVLHKIDDLGHEREKVEELVKEAVRQGHKIYPYVQEWLQATETILQTRVTLVQDEEQATKGCFHLKSCYHLSKKAIKVGEDIDAKLKQGRDIGTTVSHSPSPPPSTRSESSSTYAAYPSRQSIFNQIMDSLSNNEETSIVGVWGMGGVGKTTLAEQVAKQAEEDKLFDKVVMASNISQTPIISEIQTQLARTLGLKFEGGDRSDALMNSMKNQKKILVILDDIWGKLDLEKIGIPIGDDHKGCKLLLTSREYEVVLTDMKAQQVFHLPHLREEEAWSLFKSTAGDSVEYSLELKAIADDIVRKCEGLPVAIVTTANALKNKSIEELKNALKELKMAKPTNVRGMSNSVYSCLEMSYNHLEGDEVKMLFLLCGLLGGRLISKDHLLLHATGLNMFEGMHSTGDAANKLITLVGKLIASSLLIKAEKEDNDTDKSLFFDDLFVKMHDVVRDVARSIASRDVRCQYVVTEAIELREWERRGEYRNHRGISLECQDTDELPPRLVCPELELFLLNSSPDQSDWWPWGSSKLRIPDAFFQGVGKLRVLHLSGVSLRPPPSSLGFLSNLSTLCLIRCKLEDIPLFIGEMKTLQVLSLAWCIIAELPKEIGQLKDLRVLDLQYCMSRSLIPQNVISSLSGLECLNLIGCHFLNTGACLSKLKELPGLRTLGVQVEIYPSFVTEDIGLELINLTRYSIVIGYNRRPKYELQRFPRNFIAGHVKIPVGRLKFFSNLLKTCQLVALERLDGISNLVYDLANENGFPQLKCLIIKNCSTIRHIFSSSLKWVLPCDTFCRLDQLDLCSLPDLESVFDFHESPPILVQCFGKLRSLYVMFCEKLRCVMSLPRQHGRELNFFPQLQKLHLRSLQDINSFYSTAAHEHSEVPMTILFNQKAAFPALEELDIRGSGRHLRALWHNQVPADSFSKLKKLKVKDLHELQKVFSVSLVKALVQLEELNITGCKSLEEIVASNEGYEDTEDEVAFFPKLTYLYLLALVQLGRFCSRAIKLRWPLLKELYVAGCDNKVRTVFEEIGSEGEVDAPPLFFVEKEAFPYLEALKISFMMGVVEIWRGQFSMVSFSNLSTLIIEDCQSISFVISWNMVNMLHNLELLWVENCGSMNEVIPPLDDEPTINEIDFSKLKGLYLYKLQNLKGFSSATCTFRFPSLEELEMSECYKMEFFCNGDLHINNKTLEEYISQVLHSNTQAIHETSTGQSSASGINASTS